MRSTATVTCAVLLSVCLGAQAEGARVSLSIEAQPMRLALRDLGQQTGLSIVFREENATWAQVQAPRIEGDLSAQEALDRMLANTALKYRFVNPTTVVISGKGSDSTAFERSEKRLQLALAADATIESNPGAAAEAQAQSPVLGEVIVTAQKRAERLIEVPISIVALNGDELTRRNVENIDALSAVVPGLVVNQGAQSRRIMLRGIANSQGSSSLIGMYLDEASVTSAANSTNLPIELDLHTYDVERVEVLRGPQGTLYGDGSSGGTVRVINRQPQLDRFAASTDLTASFTGQGEPSGRVQAMANLPLIDSKLGLRIVGTFDRQGGWIDQPAAGRKDYNDRDLTHVRVQGLWRPAPQFAVKALAVIQRDDTAPSIGEDEEGNFTQVFGLTSTPHSQSNYDIFNLTLNYDFPAFQLLSTSTYIEEEVQVEDQGRYYLMFPPPDGVSQYLFGFSMKPERFVQEIRLTSAHPGPLKWTLGVFYRDAESRIATEGRFGFAWTPGEPLPAAFGSLDDNTSESWSAFGDASYALSDRFTLGVGLRYFEDRRGQVNLLDGVTQAGTFDSVDPRLYAKYQITPQLNTYASASKGFRSGGFNIPFGPVLRPSYAPESVWTYELGLKSSLLDGRLSTDSAVFYTDYSDYQVVGVDVNNPVVGSLTTNAGDVWIKGVELALNWRPAGQWEVGLNGTYIDSEFDRINLLASSAAYIVGDRPDYSVKYAYSISAQRDFSWRGRAGFARFDYRRQGPLNYRNRTLGPDYFAETDAIDILNANLGIDWNEHVSLSLFAQNLLDNRDYNTPDWLTGVAPRTRPRTVGVKLGVRLD